MKQKSKISHIVVDMIYDFIDGTLACGNAENAVRECVSYIGEHPEQNVFYILDHHPLNHCSFKEYGGIWPVHCVAGTRGGELHKLFYDIKFKNGIPCSDNMFFKGCDSGKEQYSGFYGVNEAGRSLDSVLDDVVVVSGIATEFCVRESCLDLLKSGRKVFVLEKSLAYVDWAGHEKTIEELKESGIKFI